MKHHGQSGKVVAQGSSFPKTPPVNVQHQGGGKQASSDLPGPTPNPQVQTGGAQAPSSLPAPVPNKQHNHGHGGGMKY